MPVASPAMQKYFASIEAEFNGGLAVAQDGAGSWRHAAEETRRRKA